MLAITATRHDGTMVVLSVERMVMWYPFVLRDGDGKEVALLTRIVIDAGSALIEIDVTETVEEIDTCMNNAVRYEG